MRRGYSLVELVVAMVIVSSVSIVLAGLLITIVSDIPRLYGIVQENTSVLNILGQLQKDIDAAKELPKSYGEYTSNKNLLLIELPQGIVCYQLKDGRVLRRRLSAAEEQYEGEIKVWSVPNAKLEWQVRRNDRDGCVLEVKTCIEHKVRGRSEEKMANSYLFFTGAFQRVVE